MERSFGRIQPSPGSLVYLMVSALIAFAAFHTQANLLFWAFGLVVGAFGVSILASLVMLNGLEVQRLAPARGVAGEPLILRHNLVNHSRLACFSIEIIENWTRHRRGLRERLGLGGSPNVQGTNPTGETPPRLKRRPLGWALHIGPGQSIQAETPCWPRRRGPLKFEKIIVRSGFPFGVLRKAVQFNQPGEVLIYPPLRRLNRQAVLSLSNNDITNAKHADRGGGMGEFFGLRPYRPGDSYKLIDWKHSARTSSLVSRELARPRPPRMMILLDLSTPDTLRQTNAADPDHANWVDAQEEAINLTGSLIREAYLHSIHVGLTVAGAHCPAVPMHHNQAHRRRLLDTLARLDLTDTQQAIQHTPTGQPTVIVRPHDPAKNQGESTEKASIINISGNGQRTQKNTRAYHTHKPPPPQPIAPG